MSFRLIISLMHVVIDDLIHKLMLLQRWATSYLEMTCPVVTIEEGKVKGTVDYYYMSGSYYSFLGIPYAKAPIDELRFKAPVPVEPWNGTHNATKEGPACPSRHMLFLYPVGKEDNCLHLNVYTKSLPTESSSLKPVMVWIHGGGFIYGSNQKEIYNPSYLMSKDIVVVCINYRVGALGFLSLEDPSLDIPGNAGMKDMVLALKWVQRNIRHFCGDPNNVTIFGESAGGAAVEYLLMSPSSKGLFHKAIAQSGSCLNNWAKGCNNGTILAEKLGWKETDERKILERLRSLPPKKIVDAQRKILDTFEPSAVRPFGPIVEKKWSKSPFLTEDPLSLLKSGHFIQVPLIMGYTSREGMLFEFYRNNKLVSGIKKPPCLEDEIFYELNIKRGSNEANEIVGRIREIYFNGREPSQLTRKNTILLKTDNMFLYGIYESLNRKKLVSKSPIYVYRMTLNTPWNMTKKFCVSKCVYLLMILNFIILQIGDGLISKFLLWLAQLIPQQEMDGTCHADDLGFLFKTFMNGDVEPKSVREIYIKRFVKMWTNFARTGNPTPDQDDSLLNVQWKPVTKNENHLLNIGNELKMEVDSDKDRLKFWSEISNKYK